MDPNRSYLSASESRSQIRGTEFRKFNDTVTIMLAFNTDRSHYMPVTYIVSAKKNLEILY